MSRILQRSLMKMEWNWLCCQSYGRSALCLYLRTHRGVDFDDPQYGLKEEDKDPVKVELRPVCFSMKVLTV